MSGARKGKKAEKRPVVIAIETIQGAGIALAQLEANGKIIIDEDSHRWLDDLKRALSDAEDALAPMVTP